MPRRRRRRRTGGGKSHPPKHRRWGYHGTSDVSRDGLKVTCGVTEDFARSMRDRGTELNTDPIQFHTPGKIYRWDTINDDDRARLEAEIGAPFVRDCRE